MANFKLERINKSVQHALDNKNTIHYLRILNIRNDDYNEQCLVYINTCNFNNVYVSYLLNAGAKS